MSLRRMMFSGLKNSTGVYKNVALASNGGSAVLNYGSMMSGTSVNNMLNGNRQVPEYNYPIIAMFSTAAQFVLDFGGVKKVEELNFCHGFTSDYQFFSENIPNNNTPIAAGINPSSTVEYSIDGTTYTTLNSSLYSVTYLFSQNILTTSFNARYIRITLPTLCYITGIEAWGTN